MLLKAAGAILIIVAGYAVGIALRSPSTFSLPSFTSSKPVTYERKYPAAIKATFDPGSDIFNKLLNKNYARAKEVGLNTVYIYVNYDYDQGALKIVSPVGGPHFSDSAQTEYGS